MRSRSSRATALTSSPGARRLTSGKSMLRLRRSVSTASAIPGYCTFTATSRPSWVVARWTCPIEAAATGCSEKSAKCSSSGPPRSASATRRTCSKSAAGTSSRSAARRSLNALALALGHEVEVDRREHLADLHGGALHLAELGHELVGHLHRPLAAGALGPLGVRTALAARVPTQRAPWPATSPPNFAERPRREVGMRGMLITVRPSRRPQAIRLPPCPHRCSPSTPRRCSTGPSSRCRSRSPDADGQPVNALLGTANLVLQVDRARDAPRAVVLCFGAEAAEYRVELFAPYHADRPPMPDELAGQWADAAAFFGAFGWLVRCPRAARGRRPARQPGHRRGGRRRHRAAVHRRPRHVPVRERAHRRAVPGRPRRQGARDDRARRGAQALRDRAGPGPRLHRPARRPLRRVARGQGHRREDRARPAARARHARGAARGRRLRARRPAPAGRADAARAGGRAARLP